MQERDEVTGMMSLLRSEFDGRKETPTGASLRRRQQVLLTDYVLEMIRESGDAGEFELDLQRYMRLRHEASVQLEEAKMSNAPLSPGLISDELMNMHLDLKERFGLDGRNIVLIKWQEARERPSPLSVETPKVAFIDSG